MTAVAQLVPEVATTLACRALSVSRATLYRRRCVGGTSKRSAANKRSARRIDDEQRREILEVLNSKRFVDKAPAEVYATLLDDDRYLCSERTMYRLLAEHGAVRERRDQLRHPQYSKPELLATRPNEVWSWDITKLRTRTAWTYLYLYVILDISAATSSAG